MNWNPGDITMKIDEIAPAHLAFDAAIQQMVEWEGELDVCNEALLGRVMRFVLDSAIGLLNTNMTNLTRITKRTKRSEWQNFVDSNRMLIRAVEKLPYQTCGSTKIPIPNKMSNTFVETIDHIREIYSLMGMVGYSTTLAETAEQLSKNIVASQPSDLKTFINNTSKMIDGKNKMLAPAWKQHTKDFNGRGLAGEDAPFKDHFVSMAELAATRVTLSECAKTINDIGKVLRNLKRMEDAYDITISKLTDGTAVSIDRNTVKRLVGYVRMSATMFDMFGSTVDAHMAVEANMVHGYNTLNKLT